MMASVLTPAERQRLKAQAHRLHPVVMIGEKGLTPAVLQAIDAALTSHELIKIRVAGDDRDARQQCLATICASLDAAPVQQIGKILVIYRETAEPAPAKPRTPTVRKPRRPRSGQRQM